MKRSSPMRSSGPLAMSRTPVASTTIAPGRPAAKRPYHSSMFGVTRPSSVARQGTIAGTHVRLSSVVDPTVIGVNSSDRAASVSTGQLAGRIECRTGCSGCHIRREIRDQKSETRGSESIRDQRSEAWEQEPALKGTTRSRAHTHFRLLTSDFRLLTSGFWLLTSDF